MFGFCLSLTYGTDSLMRMAQVVALTPL